MLLTCWATWRASRCPCGTPRGRSPTSGGTYWSGKYEQLTGLIPQALTGLRATLHAADTVVRPKAAEHLARGYWVAASTLTHLRQPDAAFLAVRRAVDLADSGDDALLVATLKGSVSWQLMVGGRFGEAERVAVRTAESIEPHRDVPVPHLSAYGSLLVTAATAAARDDRRAVAGDFLGAAAEVAQRVGSDRTDHETPFGPSQVTMQTVDVGVVTEDYTAALEAASRMPADPGLRWPPAAATWLTEPARTSTWARKRRRSRCCSLLRGCHRSG